MSGNSRMSGNSDPAKDATDEAQKAAEELARRADEQRDGKR